MEIRLPKEKILKTYQRYSLPIQAQEPAEVKKLEFFYIGGTTRHIDKLKEYFGFGYMTGSVDHAMITLKRLLKKTGDVTIPDAIIAEAGIGMEKLTELHRFLAGYKILADMPFIVEATGLSRTGLDEFKRCSFIDEVIYLTEFAAPQLLQKVNFLKKVKQRWVHQPATCTVEKSVPLFSDLSSFFKRALDLAISASLLLLLSPVMLLIALAIRLESNGPILTGAKRVGRGFRIFDLLKFRTMMLIHEQNGLQGQALHHHSMSTKTGYILRKTGLDDLPQLLNVLLGDLSLVGYRPLMLHEAAKLTTDDAAKRFLSPAGITGLWQFRKNTQEAMPLEECQPDVLYDLWANTIMQKTNA